MPRVPVADYALNAHTVDGYHASASPTADMLLAMDSDGHLPPLTAGRLHVADANAEGDIILESTTGTNALWLHLLNTGGNYYIGVDNNTGTRMLAVGGAAYALTIASEGARPLILGTSNAGRIHITADGEIGLNTATVPHGGIGYAMLAFDGPTGAAAGPHVQYTVSADDYPLFQHLNWSHDSIELLFDAYYDGAYRSSDAGSNFGISKASDVLKLIYDEGVAQGAVVTWSDGIILNKIGNVNIPNLAGVGVRAVVADAAGNLSAP